MATALPRPQQMLEYLSIRLELPQSGGSPLELALAIALSPLSTHLYFFVPARLVHQKAPKKKYFYILIFEIHLQGFGPKRAVFGIRRGDIELFIYYSIDKVSIMRNLLYYIITVACQLVSFSLQKCAKY